MKKILLGLALFLIPNISFAGMMEPCWMRDRFEIIITIGITILLCQIIRVFYAFSQRVKSEKEILFQKTLKERTLILFIIYIVLSIFILALHPEPFSSYLLKTCSDQVSSFTTLILSNMIFISIFFLYEETRLPFSQKRMLGKNISDK